MHSIGLQSQARQVLGIDLKEVAPNQRHSGASVELIRHRVELLLAVVV